MNPAGIVRKLRESFSQSTLSADDTLFIPSAGHIFDVEEAERALCGKEWWEIPLAVLIMNRDRMSYLTKAGFCFLLPAFLTAAIEHAKEVDVLQDNIVYMLTPPQSESSDHYKVFENRISGLSTQQAQVIADFFENYTRIYPVEAWSFTETDQRQITHAYVFWKARS